MTSQEKEELAYAWDRVGMPLEEIADMHLCLQEKVKQLELWVEYLFTTDKWDNQELWAEIHSYLMRRQKDGGKEKQHDRRNSRSPRL